MEKTPSKLDLHGTGHCASFNFRRTARAVTRLFDFAIQDTGLRSTQFTILVGIAKNQPVAVGNLAEVIMIDSTTLTRSLKPLEKEGLIKISGRAAKRRRFLCLTRKGERILGSCVPAWRKVQKRFVTTVGPACWKDLRDELEKLAHLATELEMQARDFQGLNERRRQGWQPSRRQFLTAPFEATPKHAAASRGGLGDPLRTGTSRRDPQAPGC